MDEIREMYDIIESSGKDNIMVQNSDKKSILVNFPDNSIDTKVVNNDVKHICVFGGSIANCGEDNASKIVDQLKDVLETFIYWPTHLKGRVLVRPLYYKNIRDACVPFENLRTLGIIGENFYFSWGKRSLSDCGWITPKLKTLIIATSSESEFFRCWESPMVKLDKMLKEFEVLKGNTFRYFPKLRQIIICRRRDTLKRTLNDVICTHYTPYRFPWKCERLLWIAFYKHQVKWKDLSSLEKISLKNGSCLMGCLPKDILKMIVSLYLHRRYWLRTNPQLCFKTKLANASKSLTIFRKEEP